MKLFRAWARRRRLRFANFQDGPFGPESIVAIVQFGLVSRAPEPPFGGTWHVVRDGGQFRVELHTWGRCLIASHYAPMCELSTETAVVMARQILTQYFSHPKGN